MAVLVFLSFPAIIISTAHSYLLFFPCFPESFIGDSDRRSEEPAQWKTGESRTRLEEHCSALDVWKNGTGTKLTALPSCYVMMR